MRTYEKSPNADGRALEFTGSEITIGPDGQSRFVEDVAFVPLIDSVSKGRDYIPPPLFAASAPVCSPAWNQARLAVLDEKSARRPEIAFRTVGQNSTVAAWMTVMLRLQTA